jgi:hypothetical protein
MEMNSRQRTNFLVLTFQRQEGIEDTEAERDLQDSDVGYIWFVRDLFLGKYMHVLIILLLLLYRLSKRGDKQQQIQVLLNKQKTTLYK